MLINKIVKTISTVKGVKGIVLGGSQSRGEADNQSDYDIGVYYDADILDIYALDKCLKELNDEHKDNMLNPPGEWGPWINGGAWLTINGIAVDILLRDIKRVKSVLQDCITGKITIDYQSGHPFGFVNTIYAAEIHYCKPLWQDEASSINNLKALLYSQGEYSLKMREAIIKKFLWEAWFSITCSRKAAYKGDVNYTMGSVFRTVCSWIEVLYALNFRYLMNEKGSLKYVNDFEIKPVDMEERVKDVYRYITIGNAETAYGILDELQREIGALTSEIQPFPTKIR